MAGINDVAKASGVKEADVKAVFEAIKNCSERVIIKGFGSFEVKTSAARTGRNPQTGEALLIPAKAALKFKAAK